jgi:hypothetical protein
VPEAMLLELAASDQPAPALALATALAPPAIAIELTLAVNGKFSFLTVLLSISPWYHDKRVFHVVQMSDKSQTLISFLRGYFCE